MSYQTAYSIRPKPMERAEAPTDDPRYRAWIRTFPCIACGAFRKIEAAHTGPHGLGQKSDSRTCIPLCEACHRKGPQSLHGLGPVEFEQVHVLSVRAWMEYFNRMWNAKKDRRAA